MHLFLGWRIDGRPWLPLPKRKTLTLTRPRSRTWPHGTPYQGDWIERLRLYRLLPVAVITDGFDVVRLLLGNPLVKAVQAHKLSSGWRIFPKRHASMAAPVALDSQRELVPLRGIFVWSPHGPFIAHRIPVDVTKYPQTQARLWRINLLQKTGFGFPSVRKSRCFPPVSRNLEKPIRGQTPSPSFRFAVAAFSSCHRPPHTLDGLETP